MKEKLNAKGRKFVYAVIIMTLFFTLSFGGVYASSQLTWNGQPILDEALEVIDELVLNITELDTENQQLQQAVTDLETELALANASAQQFETDICTAIENLPNGHRSRYDTWCPPTP